MVSEQIEKLLKYLQEEKTKAQERADEFRQLARSKNLNPNESPAVGRYAGKVSAYADAIKAVEAYFETYLEE